MYTVHLHLKHSADLAKSMIKSQLVVSKVRKPWENFGLSQPWSKTTAYVRLPVQYTYSLHSPSVKKLNITIMKTKQYMVYSRIKNKSVQTWKQVKADVTKRRNWLKIHSFLKKTNDCIQKIPKVPKSIQISLPELVKEGH